MKRYPLWKYVTVAVALVIGFFYTLPNLYDKAPAVQISPNRATLKVDASALPKIESALEEAGLGNNGVFVESNGVKVRFASVEQQMQARAALEKAFNQDANDPDYVVALNELSASPAWLSGMRARPMYLGLDLRGGVHFLFQVDMLGAEQKRLDTIAAEIRMLLRGRSLRHAGINRADKTITIAFQDSETQKEAERRIERDFPDLLLIAQGNNLVASLRPEALLALAKSAVQQNIGTMHNRINELGVAEPVIVQQGASRIVVQLPGVQDTAKAKEILGRTATLEVRLVDDTPSAVAAAVNGMPPPNTELFTERDRNGRESPILLKKQVVLTGDHLTDAQPGFDQDGKPAVHLTFNQAGSRIFRDVSRENIKKRMAILLIEKGKGEVVTAPVIQTEIGGGRVQISGHMTSVEANDISLLLRAGSLAAPMEIIEERTIGPSLGAESVQKGLDSTLWGFVAIVVFMILYYQLFGIISAMALSANILFLVAILSLLQATLTLPGMAAIALTLGMAIDANVLINERIREELRAGMPPYAAIVAGYERAFATILDSNVTTLIAGLALLIFGSGPVRGFAVVHCLGILTSIFSAVMLSRVLVELAYGRGKKIANIAIGQIWKPETETATRQKF
ncbi:MAG: protein translocase subunit SecD [Zoogloeaceae bacterium]|jgi:preprotein translocase subunit SecD|nr:protein translocase subunit SecD [Zoogloeaceae bacterium]